MLMAAEPPGVHAQAAASDQRQARAAKRKKDWVQPGVVFPRVQLGIGPGSSGVGFAYALGADFWPLPILGLGVEGVRGSTSEVTLLPGDKPEWGQLESLKFRVSLRVRISANIFGVGTFSLGMADQSTQTVRVGPCSSCYDSLTEELATRHSGTLVGVGGEAMIYRGIGSMRLGAAVRLDVAGPVALFTIGPVLGLEF